MRLKKGDNVRVLSGKDKGKRGVVLAVDPSSGKVRVQGIAMVVKHYKARRSGEVSAIRHQEAFLDASNIMPICSSCNLPCRVNAKFLDNNSKVRICNRCKAIF